MDARVPVLYTDRDSWLHRRDPRVKLAVLGLLLALLFVAPSWPWLVAPVVGGLTCAVVAKTPWRWLAVFWAIHLPSFVVLLVVPVIVQAFSGEVEMTERLASGLRLALAWSAAIFVSISVLSTLRVSELVAGLRGIGVPAIAAFAVGLSYRLLFTTLADALALADGMRTRGVELELRHPLRMLRNSVRLALPLLFAVIRRGPTLMCVLESRGLSGASAPPHFDGPPGFADAVLVAIPAAYLWAAAASRFGWLPSLAAAGLG